MSAFQPAPVVQPATTGDQSDVIEVVGHRPGQALKIDRRTYEVKQTPHSAQKDTLQLLRGLPAVTITPDDQISLLGASNVKILVDGHDNHTDLHTLHGSDIERIEIITNLPPNIRQKAPVGSSTSSFARSGEKACPAMRASSDLRSAGLMATQRSNTRRASGRTRLRRVLLPGSGAVRPTTSSDPSKPFPAVRQPSTPRMAGGRHTSRPRTFA